MAKTSALAITPFDAAHYLTDEEAIAEFLNASIEMGDPTVLLNALATVARARSMTQLASDAGLGRESLYKALAPGAKPRYDTVMRLLNALGVGLKFQPTSAPKTKLRRVSKPRISLRAAERTQLVFKSRLAVTSLALQSCSSPMRSSRVAHVTSLAMAFICVRLTSASFRNSEPRATAQ